MVSKNCGNFVQNCATIFKFCAAPLPEISPRTLLVVAPTTSNFCSKTVSKNFAAIFEFCATPLPVIFLRTLLQPSHDRLCKFQLQNGIKKWANFVLNCAANFKFCAVQLFADCWATSGDGSPSCELRL